VGKELKEERWEEKELKRRGGEEKINKEEIKKRKKRVVDKTKEDKQLKR
jgi:hypothetical protein